MDPKGLIIRAPFVGWILDGLKTWEIRSSATKVRGLVALIEGGTGTIVGTCELRDVVGPLDDQTLKTNAKKLNAHPSEVVPPYYGDHTYAWVLANPRRLPNPVRYRHPQGAVIWVRLEEPVLREIGLRST